MTEAVQNLIKVVFDRQLLNTIWASILDDNISVKTRFGKKRLPLR